MLGAAGSQMIHGSSHGTHQANQEHNHFKLLQTESLR